MSKVMATAQRAPFGHLTGLLIMLESSVVDRECVRHVARPKRFPACTLFHQRSSEQIAIRAKQTLHLSH
jgi:hypothetical protein